MVSFKLRSTFVPEGDPEGLLSNLPAAATAGLTRYTGPGAPMRRSKFRFVVLAVVSPGSGTPGPLPMQEPQPGGLLHQGRGQYHGLLLRAG